MKLIKTITLSLLILCTLCACQNNTQIKDLSIPLLKISYDSGECSLYEWNVEKEETISKEKTLFINKEDPFSLLYTYWNGKDKFILYDDNTHIINSDNSVTVSFRENRRESYFQDYILLKMDDNSFILKTEKESYNIPLESTIVINGEEFFVKELALSAFYVKENKAYILLNNYSTEENCIKLYILEVDYNSGISELYEVENCPNTLSPSLPPAGNNVMPLNNSFYVFNYTQIFKIDVDSKTSKEILNIAELKKENYFKSQNKKDYVITRIGQYNNYIIINVVGDWQLSAEENYICLLELDSGNIINLIKAHYEYIVPNL